MATACSRCGAAVEPGSGQEHSCSDLSSASELPFGLTALAPASAQPTPKAPAALPRSAGGIVATLADDTPDSGAVGAAPGDIDSELIGKTVAERYQVVRRIGEGGMGAVYLGRHVVLDSPVAIKVLLAPHDPDSQLRFLREAKLASSVHHPNTVYISDFGVLPGGQLFLVMEMLRGTSLADALAQGPLPAVRACRIALQMVRGLAAIHDKGIVHRELDFSKTPTKELPASRLRNALGTQVNWTAPARASAARTGASAAPGCPRV